MTLPMVNPDRAVTLPADFILGVADADLQTVGEDYNISEEGSELTMWTTFAQKQGLNTPGRGIDRYHRWKEDIEHLNRMGVRHYRTSISMARTLTRGGDPNPGGIEWYRRYLGALKENGISVYATLYHWELPEYANEAGGWTNRAASYLLQRHAEVVSEHLGDYIDQYFILNEPWCSSMLSYYEGVHAPGNQFAEEKANLRAALRAAHHLLLGQGLAYSAIRGRRPDAPISTVLNFEPAYAVSTAPEDVEAVNIRDGYFNRWFLDPIFTGGYPEEMVSLYGEDLLP